MVTIPRDMNQASDWLNKGILMPTYRTSASGNREITGVRKATLFERFKVNVLYSKERQFELNRQCGIGWSVMAKNDETRHLEAMSIHRIATLVGVPDQLSPVNLFGDRFTKLLKGNVFPLTKADYHTVTSPEDRKLTTGSRNAVKRREVSHAMSDLKSAPLSRDWAKWQYAYENNPVAPTRIPVRTIKSYGNDPLSKKENTGGAGGWVAERSVLRHRVGDAMAYREMTGTFSSIPTNNRDLPPSDFPATYVEDLEYCDDNGVLHNEGKANWRLTQRSTEDIDKGGAWYVTTVNHEERYRFFKLNEMVRMPRNLIVEHSNGNVTAYVLSKDDRGQERWFARSYGANGKAIPFAKLVDTLHNNLEYGGIRVGGRKWLDVPCPYSKLENVKTRRTDGQEANVTKKVRFNQKVQKAEPTLQAPTKYLAPSKSTKLVGQKPHNHLANSYQEEYAARATKLHRSLNEAAINHSARASDPNAELDLASQKFHRNVSNTLRKQTEEIANVMGKRQLAAQNVALYKPKLKQKESLRFSSDFERTMKEVPLSSIGLTRATFGINDEGKYVKTGTRSYNPTPFQDANWQEKLTESFDLPGIRESIENKIIELDSLRRRIANPSAKDRPLVDSLTESAEKISANLLTYIGRVPSTPADLRDEEVERAQIPFIYVELNDYSEPASAAEDRLVTLTDGAVERLNDRQNGHASLEDVRASYVLLQNAVIECKTMSEYSAVMSNKLEEVLSEDDGQSSDAKTARCRELLSQRAIDRRNLANTIGDAESQLVLLEKVLLGNIGSGARESTRAAIIERLQGDDVDTSLHLVDDPDSSDTESDDHSISSETSSLVVDLDDYFAKVQADLPVTTKSAVPEGSNPDQVDVEALLADLAAQNAAMDNMEAGLDFEEAPAVTPKSSGPVPKVTGPIVEDLTELVDLPDFPIGTFVTRSDARSLHGSHFNVDLIVKGDEARASKPQLSRAAPTVSGHPSGADRLKFRNEVLSTNTAIDQAMYKINSVSVAVGPTGDKLRHQAVNDLKDECKQLINVLIIQTESLSAAVEDYRNSIGIIEQHARLVSKAKSDLNKALAKFRHLGY